MKAYPAYKDSGIKWLGEIPEHWESNKLKYISSIQFSNVDKNTVEEEVAVQLCNYVDVYYNDQITSDLEFMRATATAAETKKFTLRKWDVIVTKDSETWDDIAIAAIVTTDLQGVLCGYHLAQIRPLNNQVDGSYLFRAFQARGINDQFRVAATGITRFGLGKYWLDNGFLTVPPPAEQRAIAAFLDRETARIDALIAKKQRQIELLQEKRTALISHAVTKGLDPNAKMKNSGIKWLGEIPEVWEVSRLRYNLRCLEQGWSPVTGNLTAEENEYAVLKISAVKNGSFMPNENKALSPDTQPALRYSVNAGDVLITRGNTPKLVGDVCIVPKEYKCMMISDLIYRLRTIEQTLLPEWLCYWLLSKAGRKQIESVAHGSSQSMVKISQEHIKGWILLIPPVKEQHRIIQRLLSTEKKVIQIREKVNWSINILKEYRTALISAAVTGKIDVRQDSCLSETAIQTSFTFRRLVLAAEIVDCLHNDSYFGRVKFEKMLFLCEYHLGMELGGNYWRQAAGPLDNRMLYSIETQMNKQKWYRKKKSNTRTYYEPLEKAGSHRKYFDRYWFKYKESLQHLIAVLRPLDTERCEIVATLFAAWNDLIIAGNPFDEDVILREVLTNWHSSKERFAEQRLRHALQWMREKALVPKGVGQATMHLRAKNGDLK